MEKQQTQKNKSHRRPENLDEKKNPICLLRRRDERQNRGQCGSRESQATQQDCDRAAARDTNRAGRRLFLLEADHGSKQEHERHHRDSHGDGRKDLIRPADGCSCLSQKNEENSKEALPEDGDPRRLETWVKLTKGAGQVAVNASDKGQTGGSGKIGTRR